MRSYIIIVIISYITLVSCYKPYDKATDTKGKILVINGLITNEKSSYRIHLSYVFPFDSSGTSYPVRSSYVNVTDERGNYIAFHEIGNGYYASDSLQFTANPGSTYILHVNTGDGEIYESDPQLLNPSAYSDSVYAEFDTQETMSKINGMIILSHGANILADINKESDNTSRFRFKTNLVTQYLNVICPPFQLCIYYYCWQTENANQNVNLTGGDYSTNSPSVIKHSIGFIEDGLYCFSLIYFIPFMISSRTIYVDQYTLNNEAYLYYKQIDELLKSNGKLFDPIATQINGNIKCLSHPENKVFGFFEASSVSHACYIVDFRNLINAQPSIIKVPYLLPPKPTGYLINEIPPFWVD